MANYIKRKVFKSSYGQRIPEGDDFDHHQAVARSSYGDMLHDNERNVTYEMALKKAIKWMHDHGRPAEVLDIGTGTGLLSMIAVRQGADRVVACEAFGPIAECAEKILEENNMLDKVLLVTSLSHALREEDIGGRANILVAEVFDTELIGEGALETFRHALENLLEHDPIVIPQRANVYAQPVRCPFFRAFFDFKDICLDDLRAANDHHDPCRMCILAPEDARACPGLNSVHDVQLDCLDPDHFITMSDPEVVSSFNFNGSADEITFQESKAVQFMSRQRGEVDCIFMWWELIMDDQKTPVISTAPYWAHPDHFLKQWRDHWMSAVYRPLSTISVEENEVFNVIVGHDEYSYWFDCRRLHNMQGFVMPDARPLFCDCGLHMACSRTRLAALYDPKRYKIIFRALQKIINNSSICLSYSDNSLLPIMAAKLGAKKVFVLQKPDHRGRFCEQFMEANSINGEQMKILRTELKDLCADDLEGEMVNTIIGEPHFADSMLPWEDIHFNQIRQEFERISKMYPEGLSLAVKNPIVIPHVATIRAVGVQFRDLHKVKGTPLKTCLGFDMASFDELIFRSSQLTDSCIECHPLWEYPCFPLTPIFDLLQVKFGGSYVGSVRQQERAGSIDFSSYGECNGVAMWVDYNFDENSRDSIISNGPTAPLEEFIAIEWNMFSKQGVFFLSPPENVNMSNRLGHKTVYDVKEASIHFQFEILDSPNQPPYI